MISEPTVDFLAGELTDTRYLFEIIFKAIESYRDEETSHEMYCLHFAMENAMKKFIKIEDALADIA